MGVYGVGEVSWGSCGCSLVGEPSNNLRRQGAGLLVVVLYEFGLEMETYDGPAWRLISTLCGESATRNLANHSMRIQDVYVGTVPIRRFISA